MHIYFFLYIYSYDVKRFEEGFTVDVKLAICIPIGDDDTLCIPHDNVMHLIENEYIPACVHELHFIRGYLSFYHSVKI